jgi:hypothetical protein
MMESATKEDQNVIRKLFRRLLRLEALDNPIVDRLQRIDDGIKRLADNKLHDLGTAGFRPQQSLGPIKSNHKISRRETGLGLAVAEEALLRSPPWKHLNFFVASAVTTCCSSQNATKEGPFTSLKLKDREPGVLIAAVRRLPPVVRLLESTCKVWLQTKRTAVATL